MRAFLTLIVGVVLLLTVAPGWAATDRRVALVIGNSAYQSFPALPNPRNDAEDVAGALKRVGFTVLGGANLTREQMRHSLRQFARAAHDAEAALVFYAGHGLQYRGRNYIVPTDAKLEDEFDLEYETVSVNDIVEELNRINGQRILILDACRNMPLARGGRDPVFSSGLAKLSGRGLIVVYSAQANQFAYDGTGRNSIFTTAFLEGVQAPGLDVAEMFQRVSMNVVRATQGRQTPELSMYSPGRYYLNNGESEHHAWSRVRASDDLQLLRDFTAKYPTGEFHDQARELIRRLEAGGAQAQGAQALLAQNEPAPSASLQLAQSLDAAATARAREEERLAWERLQAEQNRRAQARIQAERERAAAAEQERQRQAQDEEHKRVQARRAEQDRLADEARRAKMLEDRAAAQAAQPPLVSQGAVERRPELPAPGAESADNSAVIADCPKCPKLVAIPGGKFRMGNNGDPTERPVREVTVRGFAAGRFPVTVAEWGDCVLQKGCTFEPGGDSEEPVRNVSWDDAQAYIAWLSRVSGRSYRLLTEAEWEYAARAGSTTRYWWGDQFRTDMSPCRSCTSPALRKPPRVGSFPANRFGLHDVTGSISQWTQDCWHKDFRGAPRDASARVNSRCAERVLRGGAWNNDEAGLRITSREFYDASVRYPNHGFRVARDN
jgi:formylglycine-generating enzyme required for sulfatase activity